LTPGLFIFAKIYYDAGGRGLSSVGGLGCEITVSADDGEGLGWDTGAGIGATSTTAGFSLGLRNVTTPTTIGMAMKSTPPHNMATPVPIAAEGSLLPNTSILEPGIAPVRANIAPIHKLIRPGHPHNRAVAIVAIRPVVFLSIRHSPFVI
jgi:hypothetical protein